MKPLRNLKESYVHRVGREMAELAKLNTLEEFEERFIPLAERFVPGDCLCWNNWETDWSGMINVRTNENFGEWLNGRLPLFGEVVGRHPVVVNGSFSETANDVLRLSDFPGAGQFHRNPLYQHIYRHMDSRHQIAHTPCLLPDRRIVLTWNRRGLDFTDEDMDLFRLLGKHLDLIAKGIEERRRLHMTWKTICGFIEPRAPELPLDSLGTKDLRLLTQLARGRSVTSIAGEAGLRRDTLAKRIGGIREALGLENQRQLLRALADLRAETGCE